MPEYWKPFMDRLSKCDLQMNVQHIGRKQLSVFNQMSNCSNSLKTQQSFLVKQIPCPRMEGHALH